MPETIKIILEKLDPRDILSYVLPGTLVLSATIYAIFGEAIFSRLIKDVSFLYLLIFLGFSYIFGFAIYHGGVLARILKEHNRKDDKEHFDVIKKFQALDENTQKHRERIVILKQMCGCSSLSFLLAYIIYCLKLWKFELELILPTVTILIFSFLLLKIHYIFRKRQADFEDFHLSATSSAS